MSTTSRIADTIYAFRFLRLLTTPWEETGAYKAGIIDKDGKLIRKPETADEKSVYNIFHRLVYNVKRTINKAPGGKTSIASYLTALYLLRENFAISNIEDIIEYDEAEFNRLDLNESVNIEYEYVLNHSVPSPLTGDTFTKPNDMVILESSTPIGYIYGIPMYRCTHVITNQKLIVSHTDLKIWKKK